MWWSSESMGWGNHGRKLWTTELDTETMRIDAHQHFWMYSEREYGWIDDSMAALRRDFLPADLKPELERNGFQGCVAVQARQTLEETRWLLELAEHAPFILGVVGWVDLRSPRLQFELESLAVNPKLVGVRHIVQSEPDERFLLQPDFLRGIAMLEEFDLAYDILIYTRHLPVAAEFVTKFPRQRFVLDHLAKPPIKSGAIDVWARGIQGLAAFSNVYCKVSGLVTEADWQAWKPEDIRPYILRLPCLPVCLGDQARHFAIDIRKCCQPLDSTRPNVNGSALDRRLRQMVQNKTLPRKLRHEFRCHWKMPGINQDVVGQIKFFQHGDAAKKIRLKKKPLVRLALHDVPNAHQLGIDCQRLQFELQSRRPQIHPTHHP